MNLAAKRSARAVGLEEMLFLLRKDPIRLARLMRYLSLREIRGQFSENTLCTSTGTEEVSTIMEGADPMSSSSSPTESEGVGERDLMNALTGKDLNSLGGDQVKGRESLAASPSPTASYFHPGSKGKRVRACREFLERLDKTGELLRTIDNTNVDPAKHQRNLVCNSFFVSICAKNFKLNCDFCNFTESGQHEQNVV